MKIAGQYFPDLVEEQGFLDDREQWEKMLSLVPEKKKRTQLQEEWEARPQESGRERWKRLSSEVSVSFIYVDVFFSTFPSLSLSLSAGYGEE